MNWAQFSLGILSNPLMNTFLMVRSYTSDHYVWSTQEATALLRNVPRSKETNNMDHRIRRRRMGCQHWLLHIPQHQPPEAFENFPDVSATSSSLLPGYVECLPARWALACHATLDEMWRPWEPPPNLVTRGSTGPNHIHTKNGLWSYSCQQLQLKLRFLSSYNVGTTKSKQEHILLFDFGYATHRSPQSLGPQRGEKWKRTKGMRFRNENTE